MFVVKLFKVDPSSFKIQGCKVNLFETLEESKQFIKLFPNPAVSELNLVCGGAFNYEISDMSGRLLLQGTGNQSDKIRIADFNAGVYNITCITENKIQTLRFMKQ